MNRRYIEHILVSFSTENDSLSMWNYYASSGEGVSIAFDHSWNMFEGSDRSEVNIREELKNDIVIYRGLIVYKREDKKKCIWNYLMYYSKYITRQGMKLKISRTYTVCI